MFTMTKSSIRIMMTIIMKLVPLMMVTPFNPGTLRRHFIPFCPSGPRGGL